MMVIFYQIKQGDLFCNYTSLDALFICLLKFNISFFKGKQNIKYLINERLGFFLRPFLQQIINVLVKVLLGEFIPDNSSHLNFSFGYFCFALPITSSVVL